ncbi:MAG: helix-turn-helix domain-containing protein, partial [Oliverpabstia sp.]
TLTKLADICYLNPSYLSRIFKQAYGFNITEYICKKRFERVKELLETTSKKIQEICAEVGYYSVPSFNRIFKKETGMSPIEYRNRYGDKNHELL